LCFSNKVFLRAIQAVRHETVAKQQALEHGSLLYSLPMPTAQKPCKKELQKFYNVGRPLAISQNHTFVLGKLF
jgi:hypothetical protein